MGFLKNWKERNDANAIQVWLLKMDGTVAPQVAKPFVFSRGTAGNYATDYQFYTFPKVPVNELASVVVSYNGKLHCHEIQTLIKSQRAPECYQQA